MSVLSVLPVHKGISGLPQKAKPVWGETVQTFIQALALKCLGTWKQCSHFFIQTLHLLLLFTGLTVKMFCPDLHDASLQTQHTFLLR